MVGLITYRRPSPHLLGNYSRRPEQRKRTGVSLSHGASAGSQALEVFLVILPASED